MRVRSSLADHLMEAHAAQATHYPGADDEGQQERRHCRSRSAERYPLEQSQKPEVRQSNERDEQIVQHYAVAQVVRCGTRRSSCTPRDAFNRIIASRLSLD